jgi:hypothetical protein
MKTNQVLYSPMHFGRMVRASVFSKLIPTLQAEGLHALATKVTN